MKYVGKIALMSIVVSKKAAGLINKIRAKILATSKYQSPRVLFDDSPYNPLRPSSNPKIVSIPPTMKTSMFLISSTIYSVSTLSVCPLSVLLLRSAT